MQAEVLYLPWDEGEGPAREIHDRISYDEYVPSEDEVNDLWEKVGEEEVEGDDPEKALSAVWPRWNAGSGGESTAFARRECEDCSASFTGERSNGSIDLKLRQKRARQHEFDTEHTVGRSNRSLSVGDIIRVDGAAYLCQRIGWAEIGGNDA